MADTVTVLIPAKYHDPLAGPWPWEEVEAQARPWCDTHDYPLFVAEPIAMCLEGLRMNRDCVRAVNDALVVRP